MELQQFITQNPEKRISSKVVADPTTDSYDPNQVPQVHHDEPAISMPLILSFHNLTYIDKTHPIFLPARFLSRDSNTNNIDASPSRNAPKSSRMKVLLDDISGEAREGKIMAILGASGSGKTTLIDALADRISRESLKGTITMNGNVLESDLLRALSAYVMQDDLLFPMLTVEETLMFSAEFRLPRTMSKSKKKARVQDLIDQLGLSCVAKTMIGDEGHRGVSGGERRRVSIGTDIIHNPILLFLDEPTSGLDSTSAYMVVKVLRRIAESGSIVIMSVHQPSHRILSLFDRLIILSLGQTVFSGSPGFLQQFFAEFGMPIPANEGKTEFVLDYIRELEGTPGGTKDLVNFNKTWRKNKNPPNQNSNRSPKLFSLNEAISTRISKGKLVSGAPNMDPNLSMCPVPKYANPFWREMIVIANRSITNSRRNPKLFVVRLGLILFVGITLASIFWRLDNSPTGAQERQGLLVLAMTTTLYACGEAIPAFLLERSIFMRETSYNAYRRSSYVVSHAIISIPSLMVTSLALAIPTFWGVGLAGGTTGFLFYFVFILASFWAGSSFVLFLSGLTGDLMRTFTVVGAILSCFVILGGFFITRDKMPRYYIWSHYASLAKYSFQGVIQNEFNDPFKCFMRGIQMFEITALNAEPDSVKLELLESMSKALGVNITSSTCFANGRDVLHYRRFTDLDKWNCLWITIAWGVFYRILFYFSLFIRSKNKRR